MNIFEHLREAEGFSALPYNDVGNTSIGYGRNLTSLGVSREEAEIMLQNDVARVERELDEFPWFASLSDARRTALLGFVYNVGITKFRLFKNCIKNLEEGNFTAAAAEIYPNSAYATQLPDRARLYATWIATDGFEI